MRKFTTWFIILISCTIFSSKADECTNPATLDERFEESPHVAIIEVANVEVNSSFNLNTYIETRDEGSSLRKYTSGSAMLVEALKGTPDTQLVTTGLIKSDKCYVPQIIGQQYLVFLAASNVAPFIKHYSTVNINAVPSNILTKWRNKVSGKVTKGKS